MKLVASLVAVVCTAAPLAAHAAGALPRDRDTTAAQPAAAQDSCISEAQRAALLDRASVDQIHPHPRGRVEVWFRAPGLTRSFVVGLPEEDARHRNVTFVFSGVDGRRMASLCTDAWAKAAAYRGRGLWAVKGGQYLTETSMGDASSAQALYRALVRVKAVRPGRTVTAADLPALLTEAGNSGVVP